MYFFQKEQWTFYTMKDPWRGTFDEELYVSGHTVVWSRGGQDGSRSIIKTFTMDTPVLQALWCSFVISDDRFKSEETGTSLDTQGIMFRTNIDVLIWRVFFPPAKFS